MRIRQIVELSLLLGLLPVLCNAEGTPATLAAADHSMPISVPAQPIETALNEFARQSGIHVVIDSGIAAGVVSTEVKGSFRTEEALTQLLRSTGLKYRVLDGWTISVEKASELKSSQYLGRVDERALRLAQADPNSAVHAAPRGEVEASEGRMELEEVVVTGTHIRGVGPITPVFTVSRGDIASSGFSTTTELFRDIPQNLSDISGTPYGGSTSNIGQNNFRSTGVNLRGLGATSTLTLLNGKRRPGLVNGRVFDVSQIPVSVIEKVDVSTGGQSAIYGSDAVAGVVNFVTRREFSGAETSLYYGDSAQSGGGRTGFSQVLGSTSERGGFLVAYDYFDQDGLDATDTDVFQIPAPSGISTQSLSIVPDSRRSSGYVTGHISVSETAELFSDVLYSHDKSHQAIAFESPFGGFFNRNWASSDQINATLGTEVRIANGWDLEASALYGRATDDSGSVLPFVEVGGKQESTLWSVSAIARGTLFGEGAGAVRAAFGAEWRDEAYEDRQFITSGIDIAVPSDISRQVSSAFGEVRIPVVHDGNMRMLRRLEISLAGRYDRYSDFGGTFNPQGALEWELIPGLSIRSAYSSAFRAPDLLSIAKPEDGAIFAWPDPSIGTRPVLVLSGGNQGLDPETADTWSAGINFTPSLLKNTNLSFTYFDISYKDRIDETNPGFSDTLQRADAFEAYIDRSPSQSRIDSIFANDPDGVVDDTGSSFSGDPADFLATFPDAVIFDNRFQNIAQQTLSGLDLNATSRITVSTGEIVIGFNGTYLLESQRLATPGSNEISQLNRPLLPTDFRFRGSVGWEAGSFGLYSFINYNDSYVDPTSPTRPRLSSWTTFDLTASYRVDDGDGWLSGLALTISAKNLLDKDPPRYDGDTFGLGFDAANSDVLGRQLSGRVTFRW